MKILFVIPSLCKLWGGTTTSVLGIYGELKKNSVNIELWSTRREDDAIAPDLLDDQNIYFFDSSTSWRYSNALRDALIARVQEFDIVHIHGIWLYPHFIAAKIARKASVPYVISPHGMLEQNAINKKALKKKIYWHLFERRSFGYAAAIHAITQNELEQVRLFVPNSNCFIVPNGVDVPIQNPKSSFPARPIIAFIGRIHPIKGLDKLIEAISKMDGVRLVVAGDGDREYKKYIYELVKKCGIDDRAEFIGFASGFQKEEMYQKASFLAVVSDSEVLSLTAIEAMAHGLPVLITKNCHFSEICRSGAGVVIDSNDSRAIVDGIRQMLGSDLEQMSKNALELASKYSIKAVSSRLLLEYEKILQARK